MPFCTKCGAETEGPFCSECGNPSRENDDRKIDNEQNPSHYSAPLDHPNPCPICGGEALFIETYKDRNAFYYKCPTCDKSTDEFPSPITALTAWNNSEPKDLKDTYDRILYSLIMHPAATCWQLFWRLFLILLFPFTISFNLIEADDSSALTVFLIMTVVCLGIGIPLFVRYDKRRRSYIRHLPPENRTANEKARYRAFILVPIIYLALYLMFLLPILFS